MLVFASPFLGITYACLMSPDFNWVIYVTRYLRLTTAAGTNDV